MPFDTQDRRLVEFTRAAAGVTLLELLLAMSIGALLLTVVATSFQVLGAEMEHLEVESDDSAEQCLTLLTNTVRDAWAVQKLDDSSFVTADAFGTQMQFAFQNGELLVTRSGETGRLLDGVASIDFEVKTVGRLRDDTPLEVSNAVAWERTVAATPTSIPMSPDPYEDDDGDPDERLFPVSPVTLGMLYDGQSLAMSFTLDADAPDSIDTVADIEEQLIHALLYQFELPLVFVRTLPMPIEADDDGTVDDDDEVIVCHVQPGDGSLQPIYLSSAEVAAHEAHGDTVGFCPAGNGTLTLALHEARAPEDARPYGALIGSVSMSTADLPTATYTWIGLDLDEDNDVDEDDELVPAVVPPSVNVPIDLSPLAALIEPGRAHTMVLRYSGPGSIAHHRLLTGADVQSDVALEWPDYPTLIGGLPASNGFEQQTMSISRSLRANQAFSQTEAQDTVSQMTITLVMDDGRELVSSAVVRSQSAVDNPWRGAVLGQSPTLQLSGQ